MKYPKDLDQWIVGYMQGKLDAESKEKLDVWLGELPTNEMLFRRLCAEDYWKRGVMEMASFDENAGWRTVVAKSRRRKPVVWRRWAGVAATVVLLVGVGMIARLKVVEYTDIAGVEVRPAAIRLDIASGQSFSLDSVSNIETMGMVLKNDGRRLVVRARSDSGSENRVEWNTIKVPQGTDYSLVLSDGTEILLNAETTLRFPNRFAHTGCREVWIDGEAYFKVVHDTLRPFIVYAAEASTRVLGTVFNVMAYSDMPELQVTLVSGKVEVCGNREGKNVTLQPGLQAVYHKRNATMVKREVDVSYYTAWQKGIFAFRECPLESVMETLARWYGFEVFFSRPEVRDYAYTGKVRRHATLKEVLDHFRLTREFDFEIKDRIVIIK